MTANRARLLVNGDEILPTLLEDIRSATSSIHVSVFLWFRDPIGDEVADALIERARAGVAVRVLLNIEKTGMGDPFSTGEKEMIEHDPSIKENPLDVEPLCKRMQEAGIAVFNSNIDYDKVIPGIDQRLGSIASQIRDTIDIDDLHIDHRKLILIDCSIAYCGGANIGAQYMYHVPFHPGTDAQAEGAARREAGLSEPWWKWHDSLTRFEGPIVEDIEKHFRERFILDGGPHYPEVHRLRDPASPDFVLAGAEVFANAPNDKPNAVRELYVRLIRESTRSIFIENPYLYHPAICEALCEAKKARPQLDVKLVLPAGKWNDNSFAHDAQQHEYARYLECGIEVYEYQCHFNHLKMAVFDERWSIHGSTNGNYRSLENDKDFELVVLVDDAPFARDILRRVRDVDLLHSERIGKADLEGSIAAFRIRHRDPRTLLLVSRKVL